MTRRTAHKILLTIGLMFMALAWFDVRAEWMDRSDMFFIGVAGLFLGIHGIWTVSK